jgi:hypothetical protein
LKCREQFDSEEVTSKALRYYNSLEDLKKYAKEHNETEIKEITKTPEYTDFTNLPPSEDIYQQLKKEKVEPRRYYQK